MPPKVVILGAGRPFAGTDPSALIQTSGNKRVLDWLLEAFEQSLQNPEFHFVGGYRMDEIVEEYPEIHFSQNEEWKDSGTVLSLFTAPITGDSPVYACYADTVFEEEAVNGLEGTSLAVDQSWQTRYRSRSEESLRRAEKSTMNGGVVTDVGTDIDVEDADAEFTGLFRFDADTVERARALWEAGSVDRDANIPELLRVLVAAGIPMNGVDIGDQWAELETAQDLSRFILDTKANTLRRLRTMVENSTILDQYTFTVEEWRRDPDTVCERIRQSFDGSAVIVRSSALAEDGWEESNAGRFESVLDIPSDDRRKLTAAIEEVVDSYSVSNPKNQVLVQPMIGDIEQSGVVMTRTLETESPYYVVNYDATTSSTESVTDGTGEHLQTATVRKDLLWGDADDALVDLSQASSLPQYPSDLSLVPLLKAIRELEEIIGHDGLDVEFAIDDEDTVYVLQTRPMTIDPAEKTVADTTLFDTIDEARAEFASSQAASPFVFGDRAIYGVMPDWNPAEIIGRRPRELAASLYRYLIMNEMWAKQRAEYGYRDVRPHPLMKSFAGQPYVDVRADFNSFVPRAVPDELAERLVNYYLDRLETNPEFHDKVEFEVVLTCLTFDYDAQIRPLLNAGFTREELEPLRDGLAEITREAFERHERDAAEIDELSDRYERIVETDLPPLKKAYYLLEDCRRLGTLPFAHLARTAFVATSLLRSLVRTGVLTEEQQSAFLNSVNTVARQFERDGHRVAAGELSWEAFVEEYGHLRPGTYEITSPAYRQNPEEYLQPIVDSYEDDEAGEPERPDAADVWDTETKRTIEDELRRIGLPADADQFVKFLVQAIEGREYSKFVFSRNLSEALDQFASFGEAHGFSREELSHVPLDAFFELALDHPPADVERWLEQRVREGQERHAVTVSAELPPLLFDEMDFLAFERPEREPNFITSDIVTAEAIELGGDDVDSEDIDGKIVLIRQADPGYDWLFGHDIAGLVTMYGGANSHMAVRAAEFSLPAAIGIGENRYEQLRRADRIELNCKGMSLQARR